VKAILYNDQQLLKSVSQIEKDWRRLYPNGDTDNPLYEGLKYERHLCDKRNLNY
jgi:hypothetical protein